MYTIEQYCKDHKMVYKSKLFDTFTQYRIYDGIDVSILNVYNTGTLLVQGKNNKLKLKLNDYVNTHKFDYWEIQNI